MATEQLWQLFQHVLFPISHFFPACLSNQSRRLYLLIALLIGVQVFIAPFPLLNGITT